jgi:hypothetical protein
MKGLTKRQQMKLQFLYGNNWTRNCVQIGRLVKNEPDIEMAIVDEIQNFKEYGVQQLTRSTTCELPVEDFLFLLVADSCLEQ